MMDYRGMKALVAVANKQVSQYLWHFLNAAGAAQVHSVETSKDALTSINSAPCTHYFIGYTMPDLGGPGLARFIRMSHGGVANASIVMLIGDPSPQKVIDSRDAGVNEIMGLPLSGKALGERLAHMAVNPKEFIRCDTFIGPCRRRLHSGPFKGLDRRRVRHSHGNGRKIA